MKYQNIKTNEYEIYTETRDSARDTQKKEICVKQNINLSYVQESLF